MDGGDRREFKAKWSALDYWGARLHWVLAVGGVLLLVSAVTQALLCWLSEGYLAFAPPWAYLTWKPYVMVLMGATGAYLLVTGSLKRVRQAPLQGAGPEVVLDSERVVVRKSDGWWTAFSWEELVAISVFEADPKPARKVVWLRIHTAKRYVKVPGRVQDREGLLDELLHRAGFDKTLTHGLVDWYSALRPEEANKLRPRWRRPRWLPPAGEVELRVLKRGNWRKLGALATLALVLALVWLGLGWTPKMNSSPAVTHLIKIDVSYRSLAPRPHSDQVAWVEFGDEAPNHRLLLATPGGKITHLTDWERSIQKPAWSPDGKWLAYGQPRYELSEAECAVLAPLYPYNPEEKRQPTEEQARLVRKREALDIQLLCPETGERRALHPLEVCGSLWHLAWSPSGKQLAGVLYQPAYVESQGEVVLVLQAEGEGKQPLRWPLPPDRMTSSSRILAWSPDESKLAMRAFSTAERSCWGLESPASLLVLDLKTGQWSEMAHDSYFENSLGASPQWSEDSRRIGWVTQRFGSIAVESLWVETGEQELVYKFRAPRPRYPGLASVWSPDGKTLAVGCFDLEWEGEGREPQSLLLLNGTEAKLLDLREASTLFELAWSSEGDAVVARAYKQGLLFIEVPEGAW